MSLQEKSMAEIQLGMIELSKHHHKMFEDEMWMEAFITDFCDSVTMSINEITPDCVATHEDWRQEIIVRILKHLIDEQLNVGNLENVRRFVVSVQGKR